MAEGNTRVLLSGKIAFYYLEQSDWLIVHCDLKVLTVVMEFVVMEFLELNSCHGIIIRRTQ